MKTAGVVENSGIFCSFYWIKVFFGLRFTVLYICIYIYADKAIQMTICIALLIFVLLY